LPNGFSSAGGSILLRYHIHSIYSTEGVQTKIYDDSWVFGEWEVYAGRLSARGPGVQINSAAWPVTPLPDRGILGDDVVNQRWSRAWLFCLKSPVLHLQFKYSHNSIPSRQVELNRLMYALSPSEVTFGEGRKKSCASSISVISLS
jgi:hypothetical protein